MGHKWSGSGEITSARLTYTYALVIALYLSCPAVSQIWALIVLPSTCILLRKTKQQSLRIQQQISLFSWKTAKVRIQTNFKKNLTADTLLGISMWGAYVREIMKQSSNYFFSCLPNSVCIWIEFFNKLMHALYCSVYCLISTTCPLTERTVFSQL